MDRKDSESSKPTRKKHLSIHAKITEPSESKCSRQTLDHRHISGKVKFKEDFLQNMVTTTNTSSSNASLNMTPKRSKSETPANHAIANVLYQVHMKLQSRRNARLSPDKLAAKHQERQQRAEHLRTKIETSRREWCNKVRQRQQLARERWSEMVEKKRLSLQDKLTQAARRQEAELQNVVEKAKAENVKAEETNFIIRMTKQNQQLDLDNKMTEAEGRRQQQIGKEFEKLKEQGLKREAVDKRRRELSEETKTKFLTKEQKRAQADKRRQDQRNAEISRANAEKVKRELVKARKSHHGHQLSDIMSFINNSESLWEFIGMEKDWENMGVHLNFGYQNNEMLSDAQWLNVDEAGKQREKDLLRIIQKDQFELEKLMLKRDHEILNHCIQFEQDGSIKVRQSPFRLMQRPNHKSRSSSSNSRNSIEEKKISDRSAMVLNGQNSNPGQLTVATEERKYQSPMKDSPVEFALSHRIKGKVLYTGNISKQNSQSTITPRPRIISEHELERNSGEKQKTDREAEADETKTLSQQPSEVAQSHHTQHTLTDEYFEQKLRQQGQKLAMRRNILRRTLSEDLIWAECLKNNPNFEMFSMLRSMHHNNFPQGMETRSVHSNSPERDQSASFGQLQMEDNLWQLQDENEQKQNQGTPQKQSKSSKQERLHVNKRNKKQRKSSANKKRLSVESSHQEMANNLKDSFASQGGKNKNSKAQIKTLSNCGSCSSLGLINDNPEAATMSQSTLNQQQLDSLGPVVKMTINGFPFSQSALSTCNQMQPMLTGLQDESISISNNSMFSSSASVPAFQMNSLIINRPMPPKPLFSSIHHHNLNLSKNANLYLFPIREQKLLLMYPDKEKEFDFAQARVTLRMQEVRVSSVLQPAHNLPPVLPPPTQPMIQTPQATLNFKKAADEHFGSSPPTPPKRTAAEVIVQDNSLKIADDQVSSQKQTPTKNTQRDRTDKETNSTPGSSKRDSFYGKERRPEGRQSIETNESFRLSHADKELDNVNELPETLETQEQDEMVTFLAQKILIEQLTYIKIDESQKSILLDSSELSLKIRRYLETNEMSFKYCRLCEIPIYRHGDCDEESQETQLAKLRAAVTDHFHSKNHVNKREKLNIKEAEDNDYGMLDFYSQPGDITQELKKEKEKALKRKVKKLKMQIVNTAVSHENASTYPGKELKSSNKNRLQIRCIELEKSVFPTIKNYDTVEAILNDVIKVLEKHGAGDLHLMRKLKFIPTLIDVCKRISICPKGQLKHLAKILNLVIKILAKFCISRENRNYMLQTNRILPLLELFHWCLNRQTELFFGIEFMPSLFHIITSHLKHRVPFECQQMKELLLDFLISSQIIVKLKNKHAIVKSIGKSELEDQQGQVPFFLLKSTTFLEALTAMISIDARYRPVYEKSYKIGEHVYFVLQNTQQFGITQMITTLLLSSNETFKASQPQSNMTLILPQTILSLAIMCIKVLNNIFRMDHRLAQQMMEDQREQLYHLLNFLLSYTETNIDQNDDVKELLHETLLLIGYFCLLNEDNQSIITRGQNPILQKLCNLPFGYFFDKRKKEILFPALIAASYQNKRSQAIIDQEMDMGVLVQYLEQNIREELPKIMEQEQEYCSDHTRSMGSFGKARSQSISSTGSKSVESVQMDFLAGSNPYLPLVMRFPKKLWKDAAAFYKSGE